MKRKASFYVKKVLFYGVILALALVCVIPLYWMLRSSFMKNTDIYSMRPFIFWPKEMLWSNYTDALKAADFGRYGINTMIIVVGCLVGTLLTSSMAAYAFSRVKWKGRSFCFAMILTTMMLPSSVTLIPQFMIWRNLNLIDTYWPLILPSFFGGGAFNIFLLRQFFLGIPRDLDDAARIDGAGHWKILFSVILPLSKAMLAVMVLYYGVGIWNGWFWGSTILSDRSMYPLQVVLREILMANDTSSMTAGVAAGDVEAVGATIRYATIIVATLPILFVYPFLQKYFTKGVMVGAVKE